MAVPGKPSKIGKYEVVEWLGGGGMGDVYKAIDPRIGRTVAIKVIKGAFAQDAELRKRFDIEARSVGNLQHPNIVVVYEFGEENGRPYLVMMYLDGTPLDKIITQRQNLPMIQKLEIIIEVLKALDYAHQHNVVHRDVKPQNVQLLKDGTVKLLDFGIAREGNLGQTKTGQLMGTMSYMSPEQLEGEVVDGRSDVYSTGIMLFELLTYSLPFEARDQTALIVQRLRGDPPPPLSNYIENYPAELDDIIARSMMRYRDERYASAEDFAFDLVRVQERLKHDMASHVVDQARALIAKSDLKKARELLSEVVKIDTQNSTAKQLLYDVQQLIQKELRVEKVHQLRGQAVDALAAKQIDQAANLVEQAIRMDKSDPDLLELREQVQEAKSRTQQVKKLLNFAVAAQQSDQFEVAQKAVSDALALDPTDTDAKVMQAAIARQLVAQEKQDRVQQLLQVARREISARQYEDARENIGKAKAIDPAHPEIPGLENMVLAGQQQEKRRVELQQVCSEIERRLVESNLAAARDLAASAARKFPGEERLVRLKAAADEAYEQQERRAYIEHQLVSASRLVDEGQASAALKLLKDAERLNPTDTRLLEYLKVVREAATREAAEHEKKGILIRAGAAIRRKSFLEAISTLEVGLVQFPADSEIRELLDTARQEADRLDQKKQVEEVSRRAQKLLETREHTDAINLLERSVAQVGDPELARLLEHARKEAANYRDGMRQASEQATQMLDSGRPAEALKFLESNAAAYGKSAEFQVLLDQTRRHVDEVERAKGRIHREVEEARACIRSGDLHGAEAILRTCQVDAPSDPDVLALAIKIGEEKKAAERRREDKAERAREVQQREVEAERATRAEVDARTKIFPGGTKTQFPAAPEPEPPPVGGVSSTSIGTGSQGRAPTEWLPRAGPQVTERPPTIEEYGPTEVEAPAETVVRFPPSVETEPRRETQPEPEPRKSRQMILMAVVAILLLVAGIVVWFIYPPRKPAEAYVKISGAPVGAIYRAGDKTGSIGSDGTATVPVKPGPAALELDATGYEHYSKSGIEAKPGETTPVPVVMTRPPERPVVMGPLAVQSGDAGADIFVDGQPQGVTAHDRKASLNLVPGSHGVQLKKSGYQDSEEKRVTIVAKQGISVKFDPLKVIVGQTFLTVDSNPRGTSVRVDDKAAGNVDNGPLKVKVSSGSPHTVQVSKEGYEPWKSDRVTVKENQELRVFATLIPTRTPGPSVASFVANPSTIKNGEKTQLRWDTQHTTDISIDHNGGTSRSPSGIQEVQPSETTIYTLTANGPGGSTSASVTVTVNAIPPPVALPTVTSFRANPQEVVEGGKVTLTWTTQNATQVLIEPDDISGPANGEHDVKPDQTTTYLLIAKGAGGDAATPSRQKVIVQPKPKPPGNEAEAIRRTIERYRAALESEDVGQLQSPWPTIPPDKKDGWARFFRDVKELKVKLVCPEEPNIINGDKAELSCSGTMTGKSRKTNEQINIPPFKSTFALSKRESDWHIQGVR